MHKKHFHYCMPYRCGLFAVLTRVLLFLMLTPCNHGNSSVVAKPIQSDEFHENFQLAICPLINN